MQTAIHTTAANVTMWGPCGNSDKAGRRARLDHVQIMEKAGLMAASSDMGDLYYNLTLELPILIYSGDVDVAVPFYYSDTWLREIGYKVTTEWVPWTYMNGPQNEQLGGYITHFNTTNLTFLTVRGSGHMVILFSRHNPKQCRPALHTGSYLLSFPLCRYRNISLWRPW